MWLAILIYCGALVADDHAVASWQPEEAGGSPRLPRLARGSPLRWGFDALAMLAIGVAVVVAVEVLVDIVAPLVFFVFYTMVLRVSRRVVRTHRRCRGRLAASIAWGILWAGVCAVPPMVVVRIAHTMLEAGPR
jgi:hypothetical protein